MLKRTISGAVYIAIIVGFFLLREYVGNWYFQILTGLFCALATFEVARAVKPYAADGIFIPAIIFGILFVPTYCLTEYLYMKGWGFMFAMDFALLFVIGIAIYAIVKKVETKSFIFSILPFIYPAVLLLFMLIANDIANPKGFLALVLIFAIAPLSDVFAYLVGMTYSKIKKGNVKKLCPRISPNKTVAGAIGGVVGGIIAGIAVYFIFRGKADPNNLPIYLFILLGLFGAIFTELGDLLESLIKRVVGIKDMGKIMPGHGGVMDRIDGMSLASVLICVVFLLV